jgi:hypothetical protein
MKYLLHSQEHGWQADPYFAYLRGIEAKLPAQVRAFATDVRNYTLHDHQSLHDAWLEECSIIEAAGGERRELRALEIRTRYLGPYHDMRIHLHYYGVRAYRLDTPREFAGPPSYEAAHGDLLMHEVRLSDEGDVVHELVFSRGSVFEIACEYFEHRIEPISAY